MYILKNLNTSSCILDFKGFFKGNVILSIGSGMREDFVRIHQPDEGESKRGFQIKSSLVHIRIRINIA